MAPTSVSDATTTDSPQGRYWKYLAREGFGCPDPRGWHRGPVSEGLPIRTDDGGAGRVPSPSRLRTTAPEVQEIQNDFMKAEFAVREHFGDRERPEEGPRFLRERSARSWRPKPIRPHSSANRRGSRPAR